MKTQSLRAPEAELYLEQKMERGKAPQVHLVEQMEPMRGVECQEFLWAKRRESQLVWE